MRNPIPMQQSVHTLLAGWQGGDIYIPHVPAQQAPCFTNQQGPSIFCLCECPLMCCTTMVIHTMDGLHGDGSVHVHGDPSALDGQTAQQARSISIPRLVCSAGWKPQCWHGIQYPSHRPLFLILHHFTNAVPPRGVFWPRKYTLLEVCFR